MAPKNLDSEERIRELEIKLTYLEDYVAEQNQVLIEQGKLIEKLRKAVISLAEKTENLGGNGDSMPANEKPPHW